MDSGHSDQGRGVVSSRFLQRTADNGCFISALGGSLGQSQGHRSETRGVEVGGLKIGRVGRE